MNSERLPKNCPLCHAEGVILPLDQEPGNIPSESKESESLKWNYRDHANVCPSLKDAYDKESLIAYHEGKSVTQKNDSKSFDEYAELLSNNGFVIKIDMYRHEKRWCYKAYVLASKPGVHYTAQKHMETKTIGTNADAAFDLIRHRFLCGEAITLELLNGDKERWQLQGTNGETTLVKLPA